MALAKQISAQEVAKHNAAEDLWLVVDGTVYDMTDFAPEHPGGIDSEYILSYKRQLTVGERRAP
jgi:cytochrome b involved in lipid metabolism